MADFFDQEDIVEEDSFFDQEDLVEEAVPIEEESAPAEEGLDAPGAMETRFLTQKAEEVAPSVKKGVAGAAKEATANIPFGRLDTEDVGRLYNLRDRYKEIKKSPGKLGDKFATFAEDVQDVGYTATKNVGDVLESQGKSMKTEDLLSELETRASDITYEPDEARLKEAEKSAQGLKQAEKRVEKARNYYDKQETDIRKKVEELEDRISEYKAKRFEKQELDRMRDVEMKSINEQIDMLKDEKFEYDDPTTSKQINREIELLQRQKRKLTENLKDRAADLKESGKADIEVVKELEAEKKALNRRLKNEIIPEKKKELKRLEGLRKSAQKEASEKAIQKKALTEEAEKYLERLKKQLSNKKTLTGQDLASEMKRLNKQFGKSGADEIRSAFRDMLRDLDSYVGESGKKASQAITDYQNALKDLPLEQVDTVTDTAAKSTKVRQTDAFNRALAGAFTPEEGAEKVAKADIVEMLKRYGRQDLVDDAELNKIAQLMNEGGASLTDAYAAVKTGGIAAAPTSRVLETAGTKAQEFLTLAAGKAADLAKSPVGKAAGKLGKGALKTLPFAAAALDYAEAGDLGIESELGKAAYTAVESINPLPISTGQMFQAMEEQAPVRQAAARRAAASNYGLRQGEKKEIKIDALRDPELTQQAVYKLSEMGTGASQEYARQLQNIIDKKGTKEDYDRRLSILASEPGFRKLMEKLGRQVNDDGKEN